MKGLILKEFYSISNNLLIVLLIFIVSSIVFPEGALYVIAILMSVSLSFGNVNKLNLYSMTFPVERKSIVLAKYSATMITSLICFASTIGSRLVLALFTDKIQFKFNILMILAIMIISLAIQSIYFPITFKFGTMVGSVVLGIIYFLTVILALPFGLVLGLMSSSSEESTDISSSLEISFGNLLPVLLVALAIMAVVYFLSYKLSVKIYENKDL